MRGKLSGNYGTLAALFRGLYLHERKKYTTGATVSTLSTFVFNHEGWHQPCDLCRPRGTDEDQLMKAWTLIGFAALALGLAMTVECGRQAAVPVAASEVAPPTDNEHLPFDRQARVDGISPSSTVIPPGIRIPAGTPVSIRIQSAIASTTAQSGDTFQALLVDPIVVNGQILAEPGASVIGRVMEAKACHLTTPGYLRLALDSITINGKTSAVQSSSNFLKGMSPNSRKFAVKRTTESTVNESRVLAGDVTVGPDRRLTFRLTEAIPLRD